MADVVTEGEDRAPLMRWIMTFIPSFEWFMLLIPENP